MRMYRYCTYALIVSVCVLLNLRCERTLLPVDSIEDINYLQAKTSARVIFKLMNRHDAQPLKDVNVTIAGMDSKSTDSTGTVVFDSVMPGSYLVTCTKSGYESIIDDFGLTIDSNSNTVPIVSQSTDVFFMARKGAVVKGNLYYRDEERLRPVDGAVIECRFSNSTVPFQQPVVSTTSEDGQYTFSGLPEYSSYTINVLSFSEDGNMYTQAAAATVAGKAAGDTLRTNNIILEKYTDGTLIIMNHNIEKFMADDSIMIEFSEAVDVDKLTDDSIRVTLGTSTTAKILIRKIWNDDATKLYIIPFDGAWDNNQVYRLRIGKLQSVTGKPFNNTGFTLYSFTTYKTGDLGDVEDIWFLATGISDTNTANYNTSTITMHWAPLENAASYEVYQKTSSDSFWTYLAMATDTLRSVSVSGMLTESDSVQFIVLGKNSSGISSFSTAAAVTVKDNQGPLIRSTSVLLRTLTNNTGSTLIDTLPITISTSYILEPVDTTLKPVISVKEAAYLSGSTLLGDSTNTLDTSLCYWEWSETSNRSGTMYIVVEADENASYDSLFIDFTNVTDLAGNKADTTGGAGVIKVFTRP